MKLWMICQFGAGVCVKETGLAGVNVVPPAERVEKWSTLIENALPDFSLSGSENYILGSNDYHGLWH
jgi:hypothetical protein